MPQELDQNPFTQPRNPDNPIIDDTLGRGFLDDGDPAPLTRAALAVASKIEKRLRVAIEFARKNKGFNHVRLTRRERVTAYEELAPMDIQRITGVHGPDSVREMRDQYAIDKFSEDGVAAEEGSMLGRPGDQLTGGF